MMTTVGGKATTGSRMNDVATIVNSHSVGALASIEAQKLFTNLNEHEVKPALAEHPIIKTQICGKVYQIKVVAEIIDE